MTTNIIITVDTESFRHGGRYLPPETTMYGYHHGEKYGIERIMDCCDRYQFKATFFVDVLEHYLFGESALRNVCRCIQDRGNDVQLHVHASSFPGCEEDFMFRHPLDHQYRLIREGKERIEEWTGRPPVAFRAGSYAANLDTVAALRLNGIDIDSSYYAFNRHCELSRQLDNLHRNRVFKINGVTEIPVTIYRLFDYYLYTEYSKIDINACTSEELIYVIGELAGRIDTLVLFAHSFSFLSWDLASVRLVPDRNTVRKFESVLAYIAASPDLRVVPLCDWHAELSGKLSSEDTEEFVPKSGLGKTVKRIASRYAPAAWLTRGGL